jgi:Rho termination factor, N-terminal domain
MPENIAESIPTQQEASIETSQKLNVSVEDEEKLAQAELSPIVDAKSLEKMTIKALMGMAKKRGMTGISKLKKADLVAVLSQA